jgi:predicted regulator of Ras-like GTPase activity (Roadblock/LC7/MglB family)
MIEIQHMPAGMRELARETAAACVADVAGVTAAVIATVDGFDVASAFRTQQDAARIAAMASSISAISNVVALEAGLGNFKSVTINTDEGFAIVHAVQRTDVELVINVIADSSAILAQSMHRIGMMAKILAALPAAT